MSTGELKGEGICFRMKIKEKQTILQIIFSENFFISKRSFADAKV
jgi:hypothetical protein